MNKYVISVLGAGASWGFIGFFARFLTARGVTSEGMTVLRCGISAICFGLLILFSNPQQFKIKLKDAWCFIGTGILSLLFFNFCYFKAVNMMSLSAASILLYMAPTLVMLMSVVLFKEKITGLKILALVMAFVGCALVSGVTEGFTVSGTGLLFGFGSAFGYSLYTIFGRYALQRGYSTNTINFYSGLLAGVASIILWNPAETFRIVGSSPLAFLWALGTGVFSCFLPYLLYTYGLTGLENSKASVLASMEPVVATLVGVLVFKEKMSVAAFLGVVLVLGAVTLISKSQAAQKG